MPDLNASGVDEMIEHLSKFGNDAPNNAMINRIKSKLDNGLDLTSAERNFYNHELYESNLMKQGISYEEAHNLSLEHYNVSEFSLYDPEVISEFTEHFSKRYFEYWGLN